MPRKGKKAQLRLALSDALESPLLVIAATDLNSNADDYGCVIYTALYADLGLADNVMA